MYVSYRIPGCSYHPNGDFGLQQDARARPSCRGAHRRRHTNNVSGRHELHVSARIAKEANDPLHARALVLDDGENRIAITVVDNCMMPRELLDEAKQIAQRTTGIPPERMLIAATHTHSAPAAMGCLGTDAAADYQRFLTDRIAEAIEGAVKNLRPARMGWAVAKAPEPGFPFWPWHGHSIHLRCPEYPSFRVEPCTSAPAPGPKARPSALGQ